MSVLNRLNLNKLNETIDKIRKNPSEAKKPTRIEGEWLLDDLEGPQFRAEVQTEVGKFSLEADQPSRLGGGGTRPGPMHYCLYGVAACTAATFASIAAVEEIRLRKMEVAVEGHMDFSKSLGLSENPIVEEVILQIIVDTDAGDEKIQELKRLAEERCPAVFCLTTPVKMTVEVSKGGQEG